MVNDRGGLAWPTGQVVVRRNRKSGHRILSGQLPSLLEKTFISFPERWELGNGGNAQISPTY